MTEFDDERLERYNPKDSGRCRKAKFVWDLPKPPSRISLPLSLTRGLDKLLVLGADGEAAWGRRQPFRTWEETDRVLKRIVSQFSLK